MSRPGDPGRTLLWVEGPAEEIVAKAVELIGTIPGAHSFELRYDAVDRNLTEEEEPDPTEPVRWTATAELKRRYSRGAKPVVRTITGTHVADPAARTPPGGHAQAIVLAVLELAENLGANVVALFPEYPTNPPE